jgi:hypothetical protein
MAARTAPREIRAITPAAVNGFNGVAYDPNVNYKAGVKYDGSAQLPAPLSTTALQADAYARSAPAP